MSWLLEVSKMVTNQLLFNKCLYIYTVPFYIQAPTEWWITGGPVYPGQWVCAPDLLAVTDITQLEWETSLREWEMPPSLEQWEVSFSCVFSVGWLFMGCYYTGITEAGVTGVVSGILLMHLCAVVGAGSCQVVSFFSSSFFRCFFSFFFSLNARRLFLSLARWLGDFVFLFLFCCFILSDGRGTHFFTGSRWAMFGSQWPLFSAFSHEI